MSLFAWVLSVAGMACLALSMPRHYSEVFSSTIKPSIMMSLRALGWALLAGALAPCVAVWGLSIGIVVWVSLQVPAVLVAVLLLATQPWQRRHKKS